MAVKAKVDWMILSPYAHAEAIAHSYRPFIKILSNEGNNLHDNADYSTRQHHFRCLESFFDLYTGREIKYEPKVNLVFLVQSTKKKFLLLLISPDCRYNKTLSKRAEASPKIQYYYLTTSEMESMMLVMIQAIIRWSMHTKYISKIDEPNYHLFWVDRRSRTLIRSEIDD